MSPSPDFRYLVGIMFLRTPGGWFVGNHANVKIKGFSLELGLESPGYKECTVEACLAIQTQSFPFVPTTQSNYSLKPIEMCYNHSFDDDASCDLVAIGFAQKEYRCGWTSNGLPCNALVLGEDFPAHLKAVHRVNNTARPECLWVGCGEVMSRGCLVRHVQEGHLEYRWPCPKCLTLFTRRGVMNEHRATCPG